MSSSGNNRTPAGPDEARQRKVKAALVRVFRHFNEGAGPADADRRTRDFVFHMTDWHDDLVRLARLYADPDSFDQKTWNEDVSGFLYHAVGHLLAAAKLNDTFSDSFGITDTPRRGRRPRPGNAAGPPKPASTNGQRSPRRNSKAVSQ